MDTYSRKVKAVQHIYADITRKSEYIKFRCWARVIAENYVEQSECNLCGKILDILFSDIGHERSRYSVIEHCHTTGFYRGRCCGSCNRIEGYANGCFPNSFYDKVDYMSTKLQAPRSYIANYLARPFQLALLKDAGANDVYVKYFLGLPINDYDGLMPMDTR